MYSSVAKMLNPQSSVPNSGITKQKTTPRMAAVQKKVQQIRSSMGSMNV